MIFDIFSERMRAKQKPDPYQYDEISEELRNQIFYVLRNVMQDTSSPHEYGKWKKLWDEYSQEKGLPPYSGDEHECIKIFYQNLMQNEVKDVLDMIDITFQFIVKNPPERPYGRQAFEAYQKAVNELNVYFDRASVGYQLVNNRIIRADSEYPHKEIVVPVFNFLQDSKFKSANEEFLSAHEHYRNGRYRDCIRAANSAFESVMKVICEQKGWEYNKGTASALVTTLWKEGFIPKDLEQHFRLGLPILRNKQSNAHGDGTEKVKVPTHMARYALHLAAANILFLAEEYEFQK